MMGQIEIQVLATGINMPFFLRQDRLGLKDENVFINLKCYLSFYFLSYVLTHDCVIHKKDRTHKSQKFNAKRGICPCKCVYSLQ